MYIFNNKTNAKYIFQMTLEEVDAKIFALRKKLKEKQLGIVL